MRLPMKKPRRNSSSTGNSSGGQFRRPPVKDDPSILPTVNLPLPPEPFSARHAPEQGRNTSPLVAGSQTEEADSPRDPWHRHWSEGGSPTWADLPVEQEPPDPFQHDAWQRQSFGIGPGKDTLAAINSARLPTLSSAKAEKPVWQQLQRWVGHRFAAKYRPTRRAMNILLLFSILGTLVLTGMGAGLAAYADYTSLKGLATDGVAAFTQLGDDLGLSKGGAVQTIKGSADARYVAAGKDLNRALADFQQIHTRLAHPDAILSLARAVPKVRDVMQSGIALSSVAIDGVTMLQTLLPDLVSLANIINASPIATSSTADNTPLLNASDVGAIAQGLQLIQPTLRHMIATIQSTPANVLGAALSAKQQKDYVPLLQALPQAPQALSIVSEFLDLPSASKLLGVGDPVAYLLMTLDNTEIRPIGGFQGQYAVISVNGGRIGHISLEDVYHTLEPIKVSNQFEQTYATYNELSLANQEPWYAGYAGSLGWAMRNSGLSPDFKQSAQYALWYLHNEDICLLHSTDPSQQCNCYRFPTIAFQNSYEQCIVGGDRIPIVDSSGQITGYDSHTANMAGVIVMQERVVAQLLSVTGPLRVNCPYYVTVNSGNLQQLIHYYQETTAGRKVGTTACGAQLSDSTKRFTALVTQALQAKLKTLPKTQLFAFAGDLVNDLHTKDIQIYFTDPVQNQRVDEGPNADISKIYPEEPNAENFLRKYQISSELYQGTTDDSLALNRADLAGWKLEPYMHVKLVDTIQLDANQNATHHVQLQYQVNRLAVHLQLDANGQPTAQDLQQIYARIFNAGYYASYFEYWRVYANPNAVFQGGAHLTSFSGPLQTDVPNRAYFGGYFNLSWIANQTTHLVDWKLDPDPALSWQVPQAVNHCTYTLHVQPQSGVDATMAITVTDANGKQLGALNGLLTTNQVLTVKAC